MLQDIRENAQGTIAKVIIGLLIVSLSIWGMDAIIGGFSGEPEVATVNGEDITERDFLRVVQMERQRHLSQMETPDPALLDDDQIRAGVLESLILEQTLTQDAAAQGLELSDEDIDRLITQMPQFQVDGQFNSDRFVAVVRNMGMGVGEFRRAMRSQFVVNQIRGALVQSGIVSPEIVENLLRIQYQTRDFRTVAVSADSVSDQVEVSDEDVEAYYEANATNFKVPETIDAEYIELSLSELAKDEDVSDEALQAYYQAKVAEVSMEERRAAHILIEAGDDSEAKLTEVQEKLAAGEDFAELAKTYSADTVSAKEGGDLGFVGRGMFDSGFEDAMYGLEVGDVSEPVETSYGMHIIKLLDVRQAEAPSMAALESELRTELAEKAAGERYAELRSELADIAYSEGNLTAPSQELGLEIKEQSGITREGGNGPFQHAGLVRQLFSDDVLQDKYNTELIDVGDNVSIVARVKNYQPASQRPLAEVRNVIRERLVREQTRELLDQRAQDVIAKLQDGESLSDVDILTDGWTDHKGTTRNDSSLSANVRITAFSLPRPDEDAVTYGLAPSDEMAVIIALDSVSDGDVEQKQDELKQLQQFLASQQGQREYLAYQQFLRDQAEVSRP
ncbi:SurA N-terminal domain-containing protein [Marinobacter caseinilyticus]|uniref:SurA N-terminal domain-containing protein n=1 Tax=Marinobacter caseinilyticus TaxID=2692195 RepID=UPI0014086CC0|nr:SurA N-terminal domain-containing protein [Marinobacter caseinilyticus]